MSDCTSSAMMPKERRTCGTCKNVNAVWLDCFHAANDSSYYMRCTRPDMRACEHYVDDPDSLPRRYERLAQVAREMFWCVRDPLDFAERTGEKYTRDGHYYFTEIFAEQLEALGVSVDD